MDSGDRYEVEVILQHRTLRGQLRYLAKWKGYGLQTNSLATILPRNPNILIYRKVPNGSENNPVRSLIGIVYG